MDVKELVNKWEEETFDVNDIDEFLRLAAVFGNDNEEIQEEMEFMGTKSYLFKIEGLDKFWLKIEDEKLTTGKGDIEDPTLVYTMSQDTCVGILGGSLDSTSAYMKGDLKLKGPLKDGASFVSFLELLREEMEISVE